MSVPTVLGPRRSMSPPLAWTVADVDRIHHGADRLVGPFARLEESRLAKKTGWFLSHSIEVHERGIAEGEPGVDTLAD